MQKSALYQSVSGLNIDFHLHSDSDYYVHEYRMFFVEFVAVLHKMILPTNNL